MLACPADTLCDEGEWWEKRQGMTRFFRFFINLTYSTENSFFIRLFKVKSNTNERHMRDCRGTRTPQIPRSGDPHQVLAQRTGASSRETRPRHCPPQRSASQ
jgi:hypothetical protein